jgi:HAD superfamily hydrolase (TIGR01509 family)
LPALIVFDNDGVLIDSESLANQLLSTFLTELGIPTSFDYSVRHYLGGSLNRVRADVERRAGRTMASSFEAEFERQLAHLFERKLAPMTGVTEILGLLRAHDVPFCVASSGSHARIRSSLLAAGLWHDFEGRTYSADDVAEGKPNPALFLLAAHQMGVPPARAMVIEDSSVGIEAGLAAGMTVWGVDGLSQAAPRANSHRQFASMSEIKNSLSILAGVGQPWPDSAGLLRK